MAKKTPANNRFCLSCKSGEIDDEIHLFTKCKTHDPEREIFLANIQSHITLDPSVSANIESLNHILRSDNKKVLFELGKFLKLSFIKRKLEQQNCVND